MLASWGASSILNHAVLASRRRIVITRDPVSVLPDDRAAARHPPALALGHVGLLARIARGWCVADVRVGARAPLPDTGHAAARSNAGQRCGAGESGLDSDRCRHRSASATPPPITAARGNALRKTTWLTSILSIGRRRSSSDEKQSWCQPRRPVLRQTCAGRQRRTMGQRHGVTLERGRSHRVAGLLPGCQMSSTAIRPVRRLRRRDR